MEVGDRVYVHDPDENDPDRTYEGEILEITEDYGITRILVGFETDYYFKVRTFTMKGIVRHDDLSEM